MVWSTFLANFHRSPEMQRPPEKMAFIYPSFPDLAHVCHGILPLTALHHYRRRMAWYERLLTWFGTGLLTSTIPLPTSPLSVHESCHSHPGSLDSKPESVGFLAPAKARSILLVNAGRSVSRSDRTTSRLGPMPCQLKDWQSGCSETLDRVALPDC